MNTGSRDEMQYLANIGRIARSLERLANCAEEKLYGVTGSELAVAKAQLAEDASALRGRNAQDDLAVE
jgi:hypothetical protein